MIFEFVVWPSGGRQPAAALALIAAAGVNARMYPVAA
jgi:hypothetical protein